MRIICVKTTRRCTDFTVVHRKIQYWTQPSGTVVKHVLYLTGWFFAQWVCFVKIVVSWEMPGVFWLTRITGCIRVFPVAIEARGSAEQPNLMNLTAWYEKQIQATTIWLSQYDGVTWWPTGNKWVCVVYDKFNTFSSCSTWTEFHSKKRRPDWQLFWVFCFFMLV